MTTKTQHTPGPWKWGSPHGSLSGQFWQVICWSSSERGDAWQAEPEVEKSNQRLIAAAPKLLEACKAVSNLTLTYEKGSTGGSAMDMLRAAISKACGGDK